MRRRPFLKRMAFVAVASAFVSVERLLPNVAEVRVPIGLVGDGVHDDGPAIQRALDRGGMVYVPPGRYRFGTGVTLRDGSGLSLEGSTIGCPDEGAAITLVGSDYQIHRNTITGPNL